jgi:hypothetical protein
MKEKIYHLSLPGTALNCGYSASTDLATRAVDESLTPAYSLIGPSAAITRAIIQIISGGTCVEPPMIVFVIRKAWIVPKTPIASESIER